MKKTWTKAEIVSLLRNNDIAVGRALVRLNERQTFDERSDKDTKYRNGKGFRPCHARVGTSMANHFSRFGRLSPGQARYWRVTDKTGKMRIEIYANQLLSVIEETV